MSDLESIPICHKHSWAGADCPECRHEAEILSLRAERDALKKVVEEVSQLEGKDITALFPIIARAKALLSREETK
jgi:hypothetical protein